MTSTRERQQRAAARKRLERQMQERQEAAKRRRQRFMIISAAVAVLVVAGGSAGIVAAVSGGDETEPAAAATPGTSSAPTAPAEPGACVWNEVPAGGTTVDVGVPPEGEPREGTQVMTVTTNYGKIKVEIDVAAAPCVAASLTHLASEKFYDGTKCHRMFSGMLQCGDPSAKGDGYRDSDGTGGPSYQFANENLPTTQNPTYYPAGTVALANSGPDTNGSQFFFIYKDTDLDGPKYSVVGTVTKGMDVLEEVDKVGHDGAFDPQPGGGHPKEDVLIKSVRVSEPK